MRRMAGAARPASAAVIRRRRVGDSTTLRDSLIRVLPGKASPVRAMLGTWRSCDNPDGSRRASESLRPAVAGSETRRKGLNSLWLHSTLVGHCKEQSKNNDTVRTLYADFPAATLGRNVGRGFREPRSFACMRVDLPCSMRDFG